MRKKERELLWELALAIMASAGALSLIEGIPSYVIGSLFAIGFIIILGTWIMRFRDAHYPIKITFASVSIDTIQARRLLGENKQGDPIVNLEIGFFATAEVRISKTAILKLEKEITDELNNMGRLTTQFSLQTGDTQSFIIMQNGDSVNASSIKPLQMRIPFTNEIDAKLEEIESKLEDGRFEIGWQELGRKISWYKPRGK